MRIAHIVRTAASLVVVGVLLSACQTFGLGRTGLVASTVTATLSPASVTIIAEDMTAQLSHHLGPGMNTIRLRGDGSAFGLALEEALRKSGYAILAGQGKSVGAATELAYVVDEFEGSVLVRLSTTSLDLTRIYRVDGETALPSSPVSVMSRGEGAEGA